MPVVKVDIPKGKLGIKLKDGPEVGNVVKLHKILDGSIMHGKLFENDVILSMGGTKVSSIEELLPLVQEKEGDWRYVMVERELPTKAVPNRVELDAESGIEKVVVPEGTLGLRLDSHHKVLEVLSYSTLKDVIFSGDRIVRINDTDVTKMASKEVVKLISSLCGPSRVIGIKRAPHSPRQVPVPPVATIGLVLRDNKDGGYIDCLDLLDHSPLKGAVFRGDRIIGANNCKVTSLKELVPLMQDKEFRVLTVVAPVRDETSASKSGNSDVQPVPLDSKPAAVNSINRRISSRFRPMAYEEVAKITSYKTVGQEAFISVIAPPGKLGVKLGNDHEVMDILSTSPLAGKIFPNDRVVSIDEVDVRGKDASSLVILLMASQHRTRVLGVRRKTGKQIRIAVQETKNRSIEEIHRTEFRERFPNLCHFGVPLGVEASNTSLRCKILSELLAMHESVGLANDVVTENGSFCHVIKIPKKGLSRKGELMTTLDDVMASLESICGSENDASDLLLEFLANRSPSSFLKYKSLAESRPTKRRKIEESKTDPDLVSHSKNPPLNVTNDKDSVDSTKRKDASGVSVTERSDPGNADGASGREDPKETLGAESNDTNFLARNSVPNPLAEVKNNTKAGTASNTVETKTNGSSKRIEEGEKGVTNVKVPPLAGVLSGQTQTENRTESDAVESDDKASKKALDTGMKVDEEKNPSTNGTTEPEGSRGDGTAPGETKGEVSTANSPNSTNKQNPGTSDRLVVDPTATVGGNGSKQIIPNQDNSSD